MEGARIQRRRPHHRLPDRSLHRRGHDVHRPRSGHGQREPGVLGQGTDAGQNAPLPRLRHQLRRDERAVERRERHGRDRLRPGADARQPRPGELAAQARGPRTRKQVPPAGRHDQPAERQGQEHQEVQRVGEHPDRRPRARCDPAVRGPVPGGGERNVSGQRRAHRIRAGQHPNRARPPNLLAERTEGRRRRRRLRRRELGLQHRIQGERRGAHVRGAHVHRKLEQRLQPAVQPQVGRREPGARELRSGPNSQDRFQRGGAQQRRAVPVLRTLPSVPRGGGEQPGEHQDIDDPRQRDAWRQFRVHGADGPAPGGAGPDPDPADAARRQAAAHAQPAQREAESGCGSTRTTGRSPRP